MYCYELGQIFIFLNIITKLIEINMYKNPFLALSVNFELFLIFIKDDSLLLQNIA